MRKLCLATLVLYAVQAFSGTTVRPTTTLAAETGNNTSAADAFTGLPNGNLGAGNVSKLPLRSLLYTGATTKIYVHLMPWFGGKNHVSVGYDSASPVQAERQVADMISRGVDGAIIDWYGKDRARENTASLNILHAAEQYANFEVALTEDHGAVKTAADPTQKTIDDLTYAWSNFMQSPAYMRRNGRPVVFFFGFDGSGIDMSKVKASVPGNPLFIFRNTSGFTTAATDGAFAWLATKTTDYASYMSLGYLDSFYSSSLKYPAKLSFGSSFKGFDDSIASWTPIASGRHIPQHCGQTWLRSMAEAGLYYSSSKQLENLQVVTWNDYEEGSALEPGIDNCLAVSAWVAGDASSWTVAGDESTVDHYTIFISSDGANLMPLADLSAGTRKHDLKQYGFEPGSYKIFVKTVGKASIRNQMSSASTYTVAAPPPPQPSPDWQMSFSPNSATMPSTGSAQLSLMLQPTSGQYTGTVSLQCGSLPANLRCSFSSSSVTPGTGATVQVTLSAIETTAAARTSMLLGYSMAGMLGICVLGVNRRRTRLLLIIGATVTALALAGCGAGTGTTSSGSPSTPSTSKTTVQPGAYTITVKGISGTTQRSATATLVVQ